MLQRASFLCLLAFVACVACDKKKDAPVNTNPDISRQLVKQQTQPIAVLDKTFDLKISATFPFEIPPNSTHPHLHGVFQSFLGNSHQSGEASNIDFVVMNEEQEENFANNRPSESLFSAEASHSQAVNFDLPPSYGQPVKYYLVFENSQNNKTNKSIQANFRVEF